MTTKKMLAERVANSTGMDVEQSEYMVDAVLRALIGVFNDGDNLEVRGFGVFKVVRGKERIGFNPHKGEKVIIPSANHVRFKLSRKVRVGDPVSKDRRFKKKGFHAVI